MENEINLSTKEIYTEFHKLRKYLLKTYKLFPITMLDNLYDGLKYAINKGKAKYFLVPTKILKPRKKKGLPQITHKSLNTIYQGKSTLKSMIDEDSKDLRSYYKTEGKDSKIRFNIETFQKGGKYRLNFLFNNEDVDAFIQRTCKPEGLPQESLQSADEVAKILQNYLRKVEINCRYLDTNHIGIISPLPIDIKGSYIPLKATLDESLTEASYWTESLGKSSGVRDDYVKEKSIAVKPLSQSLPMKQILQNAVKSSVPFKRRIVLLGVSGSGKSTFLKYLAHLVASGEAKEWGLEGFIPIFIDLPRYSESEFSDFIDYCLEKTVQEENDRNVLKSFIKQSCKKVPLEGQGVIFLLDALDEVSVRKKEIVEEIESKANEYQNALFIVTSRKIGYYELHLNTFKRYLIEDLTEEEIPNFVKTWFDIVAKGKAQDEPEKDWNWNKWAEEQTDYLIHELDNKPSLKRISTTPLYLTFLVLSASIPHIHLPETRAALFDRFFNGLLVNWEEKYKKYRLAFKKEILLNGFNEISWIIHRAMFGGIPNDPTEEFVKKTLKQSLTVDVDELINFWIKAGVLLRVITIDRPELILPRHLSFLEYGFACKLAELWDSKREQKAVWSNVRRNLNNNYLQEPLLLFVGKIEDSMGFLKAVRNLKDDLFHRNLIFLCHAVKEAGNKLENERVIVKELLSELSLLWHSNDVFAAGARLDISDCIYLLGGTEALTDTIKGGVRLSTLIEILCSTALASNRFDQSFIRLLRKYEEDGSPILRDTVAHCIAAVGRRHVLPVMEELFCSETHPNVRTGMVHAMERFILEKAIPLLKRLYETASDVKVKREIASSVGRLGDTEFGITKLTELGANRNEPTDKIPFIVRIIELGGKSSIRVLKKIFDEESRLDYLEDVVRSVSNLKDSIAVPLLKHFLNRKHDVNINAEIACSIAMHGEKSIISFLIDVFRTLDKFKRKKAAKCIGNLGEVESIAVLKRLFLEETELSVRKEIANSIGRLGDKRKAIDLLKGIYRQEENLYGKIDTILFIEGLGEGRLAISFLEEVFRKFNDLKGRVVSELLDIVKKGEFLVFKGNDGRWKVMEIRERYNF